MLKKTSWPRLILLIPSFWLFASCSDVIATRGNHSDSNIPTGAQQSNGEGFEGGKDLVQLASCVDSGSSLSVLVWKDKKTNYVYLGATLTATSPTPLLADTTTPDAYITDALSLSLASQATTGSFTGDVEGMTFTSESLQCTWTAGN